MEINVTVTIENLEELIEAITHTYTEHRSDEELGEEEDSSLVTEVPVAGQVVGCLNDDDGYDSIYYVEGVEAGLVRYSVIRCDGHNYETVLPVELWYGVSPEYHVLYDPRYDAYLSSTKALMDNTNEEQYTVVYDKRYGEFIQ